MKPTRVKLDLFKERAAGVVVFGIHGNKGSYKGILEQIAVDNTFVPKIYKHEKSSWLLIGVRPWFDRFTLYYGNYMRIEEEAREFLAGVQHRILLGRSMEEVLMDHFQDQFVYWE